MDGIKLKKWEADFIREMKHLEIEFNTTFPNGSLKDYYKVELDPTSDELSVILKEGLSNSMENRIVQILADTKPEDSV